MDIAKGEYASGDFYRANETRFFPLNHFLIDILTFIDNGLLPAKMLGILDDMDLTLSYDELIGQLANFMGLEIGALLNYRDESEQLESVLSDLNQYRHESSLDYAPNGDVIIELLEQIAYNALFQQH